MLVTCLQADSSCKLSLQVYRRQWSRMPWERWILEKDLELTYPHLWRHLLKNSGIEQTKIEGIPQRWNGDSYQLSNQASRVSTQK